MQLRLERQHFQHQQIQRALDQRRRFAHGFPLVTEEYRFAPLGKLMSIEVGYACLSSNSLLACLKSESAISIAIPAPSLCP